MFKKYNDIENTYREKTLRKFLEVYPQLQNERMVVLEKIDGANLQLYFQPNQEMKVGKRTSFLNKEDSFFDVWNVLEKYKEELNNLQLVTNSYGVPVRVFGELFGQGIQKRINYGPEKYFRIFDVVINDVNIYPHSIMMSFLEDSRVEHLVVPILTITDTLGEALDYNEKFLTTLNPIENNWAEGVIIKPYEKNYFMPKNEDRFIWKKKSESFKEDNGTNKAPKKSLPEGTWELATKFREYINENRVVGIFSKHGIITEGKQIGEYIRLVLEDAKKDFLKDIEGVEIHSDSEKTIFNVGQNILPLLKKHL